MTTNPQTDLPARLEAALTERFTELGNPFSAMRRQEKGPDGWPASHPVGPHHVTEVLRELLAVSVPASAPTDQGADWGALVRETGRLRLEAIELHDQAAEIDARVAEFELRGTAEIYAAVAEMVRAMADEHPSNAAWVQDCQHIADRIADAATAEHHTVDGVRHLCHTDDHYCPPVSGPGRVADETQAERVAVQPFDAEVRTLAQLAEADPEYRDLLVSRGRKSSEEPWFGMPGCTCKPWTVENGQPRYLQPHETVDKVSGWASRPDCPHHLPAVVSQPDGEA